MSKKMNCANLSRPVKLLTALGAAMAFAGAASAQATDAGRTVSNTFTLDYSVNDTPQPPITNEGGAPGTPGGPTVFTVDRLIDLTLTETNSPQLVAPGTLIAVDGGGALTSDPDVQPTVLSYTVTNTGNDNQAYSFDITSPTGTFVATGFRIFYEDDAGNFVELAEVAAGSGATTEITEDIPAGETRNIFVLADIPVGAANNQFDDIILTAETRDPEFWAFEGQFTTGFNPDGTVNTTPITSPTPNGTVGEVTANDAGGSNDLVNAAQNVFADGDGDADGVRDGLFSDTAQYIIAAPNLTGVKTVAVLATDGSAIACDDFSVGAVSATEFTTPGACVEYTITVTNNGADDAGGTPLPAASVLATGIDVVDILPPEVIFQNAQALGFTVAPTADALPSLGQVCDGSAATCRVAFINGELAADPAAPATVVIRAIVQ